jgi:hypothetical protein
MLMGGVGAGAARTRLVVLTSMLLAIIMPSTLLSISGSKACRLSVGRRNDASASASSGSLAPCLARPAGPLCLLPPPLLLSMAGAAAVLRLVSARNRAGCAGRQSRQWASVTGGWCIAGS